MKGARQILHFLLERAALGERAALVTITDVVGQSSRAPGTHMAIGESGAYVGSLSGGCIEAALVTEAQRVIAAGRAESLRFGAGSPFIDIRLPCGGGMDLLLAPAPPRDVLRDALGRLEARGVLALDLGRHGHVTARPATAQDHTGWQRDGTFLARHEPDLRLVIIGQGAEARALSTLGQAFGAEICLLSPDAALVADARTLGMTGHVLRTPARTPVLTSDPHTATVMLFHDHDWEGDLLAQALEGESFFIGAMGSRSTHRRRIAALAATGLSPAALERVVGPIGMIHAARDPDTLALSTLTQVVECYRTQACEPMAVMA
jgi:xanthine dehydrogenase accessory factor